MTQCEACGGAKKPVNKRFCSWACASYVNVTLVHLAAVAARTHPCAGCGVATANPKYCTQSCGARVNGKLYPKRKRLAYDAHPCPVCGETVTTRAGYALYCSQKCSAKAITDRCVAGWLDGSVVHMRPKLFMKIYLRQTRGNACEVCGWCEVNPVTGAIPIEMDHMDGDRTNNVITNLKLLCPNHHALTPTYRYLNRKLKQGLRATRTTQGALE